MTKEVTRIQKNPSDKVGSAKRASKSEKKPRPLPEHGCYAPPLPECMLPSIAQRFVNHISAKTKTPPEFAAAPLIVSLSVLLANKYVIATDKKSPDNFIVGTLSGFICAPSGSNKTAATNCAIEPIHKMQTCINQSYNENSAFLQAKMEVEKESYKQQQKSAKKLIEEANTIKDTDEVRYNEMLASAVNIFSSLKSPTLYSRYTLLMNDISMAALGKVLSKQCDAALIYRDELASIFYKLTKQSHDDFRTFMLEALDGKNEISIERFSKQFSFQIQPPRIAVFGTIQPSVIAKIKKSIQAGKIVDDGYFNRYQIAVSPDQTNGFVIDSESVDDYESIQLIMDFAIGIFGNKFLATKSPLKTQPVFFTDEAQEYYLKVMEIIDQTCAEKKYNNFFTTHLKKYRSMIPAIALVISALRQFEESKCNNTDLHEISKSDVQVAHEWAMYLFKHAKKIWGATDSNLQNAKLILARFDSLENTFTAREIQKKNWKGLGTDLDKIKDALTCLKDFDHIYPTQSKPKAGGRPTTIWNKHPSYCTNIKESAKN